MREVDVVIIGGGILGWTLAHLITKTRGLNSAIIISSPILHTASLQNQAWLQSGLIYDLKTKQGREDAELCIMHGRKLLDLQNIRVTERFGVMALANEQEALEKTAFLSHYGFPQYREILTRREVLRLLGDDFSNSAGFTNDTCFIKTPDQPFKEGEYLQFCEGSLRNASFSFTSIHGIATLKKEATARNGYAVSVSGEEFDPKVLFLIGGVNTKRILLPLGISDRIVLNARRCVLMQASLTTDLSVDLFMDTISHVNVNMITDRLGRRKCLFGDILHSPVDDLTKELVDRQVKQEDKSNLLENLCKPENYPQLRQRLNSFVPDNQNFSVCYKTEGEGHKPWIYEAADYDPTLTNLFIAGAGKATMAYYAANELLTRAKLNIEAETTRRQLLVETSDLKMWYDV